MQNDIRGTENYREVQALHAMLRQPGTGQISDAAEISASPRGTHAAFAGTIVEALQGSFVTRVCQVDLANGHTQVLTFGPNSDRLPRYSPDGGRIAFLSDRHEAGDFQLYLLDPDSGAARATPHVEGWVEYLQWSPDGRRVLLGVAGHGADVSAGQGAITSKAATGEVPSWMPSVDGGDEHFRWRHAWIYELASDSVRRVSPLDRNVWDVAWCGNEALVAITSNGPSEGLWYCAVLEALSLDGGAARSLYKPDDQLGWLSTSPSGEHVAVVEAVCSDRGFVAGDLCILEMKSGKLERIDTNGVDITHTEWRSEGHLLLGGHRGLDTVMGLYDLKTRRFEESWTGGNLTTAGRYFNASGLPNLGECVVICEGFDRAPEIAMIGRGGYRCVKSCDLGYAAQIEALAGVERLTWHAPDGLQIQGWLLRPRGTAPYPLVMNIHGGPVWHWRPSWLGRWGAATLLLLRRGFAVFLPNPRGSSGRGQAFARRVVGDMGGADTYDYLSGVDALLERGIADPARLGVTGGSYGGFMSSWLITQDTRFAAAVPVAPANNHVTQHLISNIPHFVALFLADDYTNPTGKYFQRSPIMHAHKVHTATLHICGALDRCTPPEEAVQFHNALRSHGVESVLVTYPEEGHGVRKFPAAIDYAARIVSWFEEHLDADRKEAP